MRRFRRTIYGADQLQRRIFDEGATSASDHYGLVAEFDPPLT